jgi:hypothetical protein
MKYAPLPVAVTLALVLSACVPSLNPLYTEHDLVFDPALVGHWAENDNAQDTWTFEKSGDQDYKAIYQEKGKTGEFDVHLVKLGERLFLDFYPQDDGIKEMDRNDFYRFHFLPVHTFARVSLSGSTVDMAFLDPDWLKKLLDREPKAIRHERRGEDGIILTASTKDLQTFLLKHADEAFGDKPTVLKRVRPAGSETVVPK